MDVYKSLNSHQILSFTEQFPEVAEVNVCVGKEWHRFPSSFFLPNNKSVLFASLLHIRSTFFLPNNKSCIVVFSTILVPLCFTALGILRQLDNSMKCAFRAAAPPAFKVCVLKPVK